MWQFFGSSPSTLPHSAHSGVGESARAGDPPRPATGGLCRHRTPGAQSAAARHRRAVPASRRFPPVPRLPATRPAASRSGEPAPTTSHQPDAPVLMLRYLSVARRRGLHLSSSCSYSSSFRDSPSARAVWPRESAVENANSATSKRASEGRRRWLLRPPRRSRSRAFCCRARRFSLARHRFIERGRGIDMLRAARRAFRLSTYNMRLFHQNRRAKPLEPGPNPSLRQGKELFCEN